MLLIIDGGCRMYESQVRKIVKIQAVLRAVMAKLHKKRGILKPGAKGASKPAKKAADMSEEQAATAIQSSKPNFIDLLASLEC